MFVVMYDLREMPASHQTFLRQRTFSVPVKREFNGQNNKKSRPSQGRTLRYLIHLRSVPWREAESSLDYFHSGIQGLNTHCLLSDDAVKCFWARPHLLNGQLVARHAYSWICILILTSPQKLPDKVCENAVKVLIRASLFIWQPFWKLLQAAIFYSLMYSSHLLE